MAGNWWDRFANAVIDVGSDLDQYGMRIFEETGFRDIWDELAAIDDEGMSLSSFVRGIGRAAWQVPSGLVQTAYTPTLEVNRTLGAIGITGWDLAHGNTNLDPVRNLWTGGQTYEEQQSAPGVYKPLTASDLRVVGYDLALNEFGDKWWLQVPGRIGMVYHGTTGVQANGSYLPHAWDLSAADAGEQLDRAGILGTQRAISAIATETVLDPLNYLAPGAGTLLRGTFRGSVLAASADAAHTTGLVGSALLPGAVEAAKVERRVWGIKTGFGLMSQPRMIQALSGPEYASLRTFMVNERDPRKIYKVLTDRGIAEGDAANNLARVASVLDTDDQIVHLFNAASYRNVQSIGLIDSKLEEVALSGVRADFDNLLGIQNNVIDDVLTKFPTGEKLPPGHLLSGDDGRALLDRVLEDNPALKAQWDTLTKEAQKAEAEALSTKAAERAKPQEAAQRLFGKQTSQVDPGTGARIVADGVDRSITFLPKAGRVGQKQIDRALTGAPAWAHPVRALRVDQTTLSRFRPSILLLTKPGVRFNVHDTDSIDKFNDLIRWADARISSVDRLRHVRSWQSRTPGYRFAEDPEVIALQGRFMDAGVISGAPQQARGKMVDELQNMVIRKMGEAHGFTPEAAAMLAEHGMTKGRALQQSLLNARDAYLAAVPEDGRVLMLAGQAALERQATNFVPIMDWDAISRAMATIARGEHALVNPGSFVSEASVQRALMTHGGRQLKYLGDSGIPRVGHEIVDVLDAANSLFKQFVLLRLGYTFRNLSEGAASTIAAGVPTADIFRMLNLGGFMADRLYNGLRIPGRMIDRTTTWAGLRQNEDNALVFAAGHASNAALTQDGLHSVYAYISDPQHWDNLAAVAANVNGNYTAAQVAQATQDLTALSAMRHRIGLGITDAQLGNAVYRPAGAAEVGTRLYHADMNGTLSYTPGQGPGELILDQALDRPIRLVEDPVLAAAHVSAAWTHVPTAGRNATERGQAMAASLNVPPGTPVVWRYRDASGAVKRTKDPAYALNNAAPGTSIFAHQQVPRFQRVVGGQYRTPNGYLLTKEAPGRWRVDRPSVYGPTRHATLDEAKRAVIQDMTGRPAPATFSAGSLLPGQQAVIPAPTINAATSGLGGTHHIQMRMNPNSPWVPFSNTALTPTTEIRMIDQATHPEFPRVVSVDTWSRELDLRNVHAAAQASSQFRDVDDQLINAARSGDHAAQDRLSEVMAGHGIYRLVLPDRTHTGWDAYQVIAHPKALDGTGFKEAIQREVEEYVNAYARVASQAPGAEASLGIQRSRRGHVTSVGGRDRKQMQALNRMTIPKTEGARRALVGTPVNPLGSLGFVRVLDNGGFEQVMEETIEAALTARRNHLIAQGLVSDRRAQMARTAKRHGLSGRETTNAFEVRSRYGGRDVQPGLLNGMDSGLWASLTSGDASYVMQAGQTSYLAETLADMRRTDMIPRIVDVDDPRWFDAMSNLLSRQFSDEPARAAFEAVTPGTGAQVRKLDPVVERLMQPGDRDRLVEETIDWATSTEEGKQWVRTLGLQMVPGRTVRGELNVAAASSAARSTAIDATRAERRQWEVIDWMSKRGGEDITVTNVTVGDAIATMASFLDDYVLINPTLTDMLVHGNISADALRAAHAADPWELKPLSGLLSPTSAESRTLLRAMESHREGMNWVNAKITRILGKALRGIGSGPETRMLRHPVFEAIGQADLRQRILFAETTLGRPVSLAERNQLAEKAAQYALKKTERTLYTLSGRSAADDWLRFVAPFFPAWHNALTRWGRFAMENPLRVGKLTDRAAAMGNQAVLVDSNGALVDWEGADPNTTYLVLPGMGGLFKHFMDIPGVEAVMRKTYIPLRSLDVIFQGEMMSPGSGPFVAVPAQMVMQKYPEWWNNDVVKFLAEKVFPVGPVATGDTTWDKVSAFLPSGVRRAVDRFSPMGEGGVGNDAWAAEYTRSLFLLDAQKNEGIYTPAGNTQAEREESMKDDAYRLTKVKMNVKVLSAFASPVALQQRGDVEFYAGLHRQLVDAFGDIKMADEQFAKLFPAEFILTRKASRNLTGGAATSRAIVNQKQEGQIARLAVQMDDPTLLSFVENYDDEKYAVGQPSEGFTTKEYNPFARMRQQYTSPEGSSETYRSRYSPDEALREARISDGQRMYGEIKASAGQMLVQRGLAPGSYEFNRQMDSMVSLGADALAAQNPIWANDFAMRDGNKLFRREQFFRAILTDESLGFMTKERADDALVVSMKRYLDARDTVRQILYLRGVRGGAVSSADQENSDLAMGLLRVRTELANGSPAFAQWSDRWFPNDVVVIDNSMVFSGLVDTPGLEAG